MMLCRVAVFTGSTLVKPIAERFRALGFANVDEGTAHVYGDYEGSEPSAAAWNAQVDYERAHGTQGGLRFVGYTTGGR